MKKVILVMVDTGFANQEYLISEGKELCKAAGYCAEVVMIQKAQSLDPQTALRKGKLEELKQLLESNTYYGVIFYNRLHAAQLRNLSTILEVDVIDRNRLILDIFSLRARSKEALLQIEMAKLRYSVATRLLEQGAEDQVGGGSLHNKGAGESKKQLHTRRNRSRLAQLKEELRMLQNRTQEKKNLRQRSGLKKVALVGYTNAGKSTILNAFLKDENKRVLAKDQVFATLDTTARRIAVNKQEFYLFDTVGFVSNLPHELIEAFRSTLSCVLEADYLLHVVDVSHPEWLMHKEVTEETLKQIGADSIPRKIIFNKGDLLKEAIDMEIFSAFSLEDINRLGKEIVSFLYPEEINIQLKIGYQELSFLHPYRSFLRFEELQRDGEGILYCISGGKEKIEQLQTKCFKGKKI